MTGPIITRCWVLLEDNGRRHTILEEEFLPLRASYFTLLWGPKTHDDGKGDGLGRGLGGC